MLAECYGRTGSDEQELEALSRVAEGDPGPESARIAYARALARSGKLDQALAILVPMAGRQPELRLDIVRLSIQKMLRLPRDRRRLAGGRATAPGGRGGAARRRRGPDRAQGRRARLARSSPRPPGRSSSKRSGVTPDRSAAGIALATMLQRRDDPRQAESVLDQAEKDLGTSPALLRARVAFLVPTRGEEARRAIDPARRDPARESRPPIDRRSWMSWRRPSTASAIPCGPASSWRNCRSSNRRTWRSSGGVQTWPSQPAIAPRSRSSSGQIKRIEGEGGTLWRYVEAAYLIGEAGRGDATTAEAARRAAGEPGGRDPRPSRRLVGRAGAPGSPRRADRQIRGRRSTITSEAIGVGRQPARARARRLFVLLYQRQRFDQIDQVVQDLADRGAAPAELKLATALHAMRRRISRRPSPWRGKSSRTTRRAPSTCSSFPGC